jgi:hypothetical protein
VPVPPESPLKKNNDERITLGGILSKRKTVIGVQAMTSKGRGPSQLNFFNSTISRIFG